MEDKQIMKMLSEIRKENFRMDSTNLLSSIDNINSLVTDFFYDSCIIDFTKSSNISLYSNNDLTVGNDGNTAILITNEIFPKENSNIINNIFCKIYRTEYPGNNIKASIVINEGTEYPIKMINSSIIEPLSLDVSSFRLKLQIEKGEKSLSPIIHGYSLFFKDSSIL